MGWGLPPPDFYWLGMTTFSSTTNSLPPSSIHPALRSAPITPPNPPHHRSICYNVSILNLKERRFKSYYILFRVLSEEWMRARSIFFPSLYFTASLLSSASGLARYRFFFLHVSSIYHLDICNRDAPASC